MTLPDNDMVNPGDGPLRPEPWGLFFLQPSLFSLVTLCLQYEPNSVLQNSADKPLSLSSDLTQAKISGDYLLKPVLAKNKNS